jgi:hypothetical protein
VDTVRRLLFVCVEAVRQLLGPAQGDAVTAVDLVGHDSKAVLHDLPQPFRREEPVIPALKVDNVDLIKSTLRVTEAVA